MSVAALRCRTGDGRRAAAAAAGRHAAGAECQAGATARQRGRREREQPSGCDWRAGLLGLLGGAAQRCHLAVSINAPKAPLLHGSTGLLLCSALECCDQCVGDDEEGKKSRLVG